MIIWSFFIGSILDRYRQSTKWIFIWITIVNVLMQAFLLVNVYYYQLNPYYLLLANLTHVLHGGGITFVATTNRYIIINTDVQYRTFRFIIYVIALVAGLIRFFLRF